MGGCGGGRNWVGGRMIEKGWGGWGGGGGGGGGGTKLLSLLDELKVGGPGIDQHACQPVRYD